MKTILNPFFLGDSVILEPVARSLGAIIRSDYPELFESHPSVSGIPLGPPINGEVVLNAEPVLGGYELEPVYKHFDLEYTGQYPRLYLSELEREFASKIRDVYSGIRVGLGWKSREPQKSFRKFTVKALCESWPHVFCFDEFDKAKSAKAINVVGRPLRDVMSWLSAMDVFIGLDSGLSHLALALNIPTVVVGNSKAFPLYERNPLLIEFVSGVKGVSAQEIFDIVKRTHKAKKKQKKKAKVHKFQLPRVDLVFVEDTSATRVKDVCALAEKLSCQIDFNSVQVLTSQPVRHSLIKRIAPLHSLEAYNTFCLTQLSQYIQGTHLLLCQWDGYPINPEAWTNEFLEYDYVGAPWVSMTPPLVGNGGFSLRSANLFHALEDIVPKLEVLHKYEDVLICRQIREQLIARGIQFCPTHLAYQFSIEGNIRYDDYKAFGFHGAFTLGLPFERRLFHHSGDLGDIIWSLPTIRALGGGELNLSPELHLKETRVLMTEHRADMIKGLLLEQSYISDVFHTTAMHEAVRWDLNDFRKAFVKAADNTDYETYEELLSPHLINLHGQEFGLPSTIGDNAWLETKESRRINGKPIVIARTARYHNFSFDWKGFIGKHGPKCVFLGLPKEHREFCEQFGAVQYYHTPTLKEAAYVLAGAEYYVGNQNSLHTIAEGMKKPMALEEALHLQGDNAKYERDGVYTEWKKLL